MNSRRNFIAKSIGTIGASVLGVQLLQASEASEIAMAKGKKISIAQNEVILFQGDSITDAGRNRDIKEANQSNAFGNGYAMIAAGELLSKFASKHISVYNKGISGNRIPDLEGRWDTDTIALKPTLLSIMIGVNDFWRTKDSAAQNTPEKFKDQYRALLKRTLEQFPNIKLIIIEPFGVKNVKHVTDDWYPDFPKYQAATREIAAEFNATFLPYQSIFDQALKQAAGDYWTTDGVHTTLAGANLMANAWLDLIK